MRAYTTLMFEKIVSFMKRFDLVFEAENQWRDRFGDYHVRGYDLFAMTLDYTTSHGTRSVGMYAALAGFTLSVRFHHYRT